MNLRHGNKASKLKNLNKFDIKPYPGSRLLESRFPVLISGPTYTELNPRVYGERSNLEDLIILSLYRNDHYLFLVPVHNSVS